MNIFLALIAIYSFFVDITGSFDGESVLGIFIIVLMLSVIYFRSIYNSKRYKDISGYPLVFEPLALAFSDIHYLDRGINSLPENITDDVRKALLKEYGDKILTKLSDACTKVSIAFHKIKGQHCGVCIKLITFADDAMDIATATVRTIARDEHSIAVDQRSTVDTKIHFIHQNSDFEEIAKKAKQNIHHPFVCNNLPDAKEYSNSNLVGYKIPSRWDKLFRRKKINWPLQYMSTIVVPIFPLRIQGGESNNLRAFLCIDSTKKGLFNKYDTEIMKGIADGLFNKIDKLRDKIPQKNG